MNFGHSLESVSYFWVVGKGKLVVGEEGSHISGSSVMLFQMTRVACGIMRSLKLAS